MSVLRKWIFISKVASTPPPPPPLCTIVCLQPLFECHQISSAILTVWYNATLEKNTFSLSLCVFHVIVSFSCHTLKGPLLFKAPIFPQPKIVFFILQQDSNKRGLLMCVLPTLIFPNEPYQVFISFSLHSNCSEIWGLSSPNTIEQWDTSGLYNYPDQTRWVSLTVVQC